MFTTLTLRAVQATDIPIFFEQQNDAAAAQLAAVPMRERDAHMAHWAKVLEDEQNVTRAIVCDGEVAGNVVCFGPPEERKAGYWLGRAYWGRGIATRALTLFLEEVAGRPLYAYVAAPNGASRRVLEKCGFGLSRTIVEEGVELLVFKLGE